MPSEKRKQQRYSALLAAKFAEAPAGSPRKELAPVLNISENGALLETKHRYIPREYVTIEIADAKLKGQATVRYSDPKGMKYRTGIEFTGGLKFKPAPSEDPPMG
jgi:hypothetical protein